MFGKKELLEGSARTDATGFANQSTRFLLLG
jgi:hypothetical protein